MKLRKNYFKQPFFFRGWGWGSAGGIFFFRKGWVWKWIKRSLGVISLNCDPDAQTLRLGQADEDDEPEEEDPFSAKLMTFDVSVGADKRLLQIWKIFINYDHFVFVPKKKNNKEHLNNLFFILWQKDHGLNVWCECFCVTARGHRIPTSGCN